LSTSLSFACSKITEVAAVPCLPDIASAQPEQLHVPQVHPSRQFGLYLLEATGGYRYQMTEHAAAQAQAAHAIRPQHHRMVPE